MSKASMLRLTRQLNLQASSAEVPTDGGRPPPRPRAVGRWPPVRSAAPPAVHRPVSPLPSLPQDQQYRDFFYRVRPFAVPSRRPLVALERSARGPRGVGSGGKGAEGGGGGGEGGGDTRGGAEEGEAGGDGAAK